MTIINSKKGNKKGKIYLAGLTAFTIFLALAGVILYNQNVNYKHELSSQKNEIREVESQNAELKTQTFNLTSAHSMQNIAAAKGLVIDKNPKFIKIPQLATR